MGINPTVEMVTAGQTVRKVADEIGVHYSTVSRWCSKHKAGEPLSDKKRCERPSLQTKVSKMVIRKNDDLPDSWQEGS